ncbi:MAG: DUF937 domain-containing protein [Tessaracoccus sp.]|uniref:DUF937 domain-containing protein n=1 Tax=Tessaracoccus sp. TaxID=1971211 RepID=UPI001ECF7CEB|nr:DUF937 domain-containing protein [Tessaracoccus sp.]MBK7821095.1 DUF937 domain-containing protein [Tessaracoccus sp.]
MFDIQDLFDQLPIDQLAAQVGSDPADVSRAVGAVLPALLMGMDANAQDQAGEASLLEALGQHAGRSPFDVSNVDESDGAKIASHVFGSNEDAVVAQLGGAAGDQGLIQKLMPILAPIVMAWLANKLMKVDEGQGRPQSAPQAGGGGILGSILGQILGGGRSEAPQTQPVPQQPQFRVPGSSDSSAPTMPFPPQAPQGQTAPSAGGGVLGDILGGLLGGGRR